MNACLRKELQILFCSKSTGLLLFLFVCLIGAALLFDRNATDADAGVEPPFRLGIADEDDNSYSRLLLSYFQNNENFTFYVSLVEGSGKELEDRLEKGELDAYLVIPEGFVEQMIAVSNLPVEVNIRMGSKAKAVIMTNLFDAYSHYIEAVESACIVLYKQMEEDGYSAGEIDSANREISMDLIFTALGREELFAFHEIGETGKIPIGRYYMYSLFSLIPCLLGILAGVSLLRERRYRTLERMLAARVPMAYILSAKTVVYGGMAFILLYLPFYAYSLGRRLPAGGISAWLSLGICFASVLLYLLLSGLFVREQDYVTASVFFTALAALAGGMVIPVSYLPDSFAAAAGLLPASALRDGLLSVGRGYPLSLLTVLSWWGTACALLAAAAILMKKRQVAYE